MLDTNVLISMIFFPGKRFERMLDYIVRNHTLVLSSFVVEELMAVTERKFPENVTAWTDFYRRWAMSWFIRRAK